MIEVLIVNINKSDYTNKKIIDYVNSILTEKELNEAKKIKNNEDAFRHRLAHAFVFKWIANKLGISTKNIYLDKETRYGKPYYANKNLFFNISHSQDKLALVFSDYDEVGIDIEKIPDFNIFNDLKSVFTAGESKYLLSLEEKDCSSESIRLWTEKEAFLKFQGRGITDGLTNFAVPIIRKEKCIVQEHVVFEMLPYDDYWCSLCYSYGNKTKKVCFIDCLSIFEWRN